MRILIVHNHYGDYAAGGEGLSMRAEADLLLSKGHDVRVYERTNAEILDRPLLGKVRAFVDIPWSREGHAAVGEVLDDFEPDVMHVNNYKFVLSPSIFAAAKERGVATVLSLRNYRLACPAEMFLRNGSVCEDCMDGFPYRILWRRCKPGGFVENLAQLYLYWGTRRRGLLVDLVDRYIALSNFAREKFIQVGLPSEKLVVKPNFLNDPLPAVNGEDLEGHGAVYVGRLSHEKGVTTLIQAWRNVHYPLTIVGDGPDRADLEAAAPASVTFVGTATTAEVLRRLSASSFLIFPSVCYESFGRSLLEAMAMGKPVVASDLGPRREILADGQAGLLFRAGDADDLRDKCQALIADPDTAARMGHAGRTNYLERFTPEKNYLALTEIYENALKTGR